MRGKLISPISILEIEEHVKNEFKNLFNEFEIHEYKIKTAEKKGDPKIERPGVYIYWKDQHVIKVGKSNDNARKRACQHLTDNTKSQDGSIEMKDLANDLNAKILFYILKNTNKIHWLIALEDYLEHSMDIKIKSLRRN